MTPDASDSPDQQSVDEHFMREALSMAERARDLDEVPIGCVIIDTTDQIIAAAHNRRQTDHDPTAHAEIIALRDAAAKLGRWQLTGCTLYVTLEPCPMCAGAIVNARIPRLVYGCSDPKGGAVRTLFTLCEDPRLNHRVEVQPGILAEESTTLLRAFFQHQRSLGKK